MKDSHGALLEEALHHREFRPAVSGKARNVGAYSWKPTSGICVDP